MDRTGGAAYRGFMKTLADIRRRLAALFFSALTAGLVAGPLPAVAAGTTVALSAYRAVYDIRLEKAASGSSVVGADGSVAYRVEQVCGDWTQENRTVLRVRYEDGDERRIAWSHLTWENGAGNRFRARVVEHDNDAGETRVTSRASLGADGGVAQYTAPVAREVPLPSATRFPMQHLAEVLDAAKAGQHHLSRVLFDGGTEDNPYEVNAAVFGPVDARKAAQLAERHGLDVVPAWRIRMAFFPLVSRTGIPDFEVEADYRADGIASDIVQDFGDFSLRLTVREMEALAASDC